ncbi:MAG TPA: hypothetical protein PL183_10935 [Aquamicrobium sp.]|nr:hypothetical protein [Aquamicrobium sp.]
MNSARTDCTRGMSLETRPVNLSADGEILVYWAIGSCGRDTADETGRDEGDDSGRRICVAYLPPAGTPASTPVDPWVGRWDGAVVSAAIRRGTAKPDYLVIDLVTGMEGCSGAVTLYGKPSGTTVIGESYDPADPTAPACRVALSREGNALGAEEMGPCTYYHGAACGFDGGMTRGE